MRIPFVRKSQKPAAVEIGDRATVTAPLATIEKSAGGTPRASLADVIGRRTPIRWFEGVAIVNALCERLAADGLNIPSVPDLADAFITADGHLETASRLRAHEGVQALARTLHVLLTGEQVPPPLRLFISKWIESGEPHPLKDFAEGLTYFARPDGPALIRTVYERHLTMPELPAGAVIPTPPIDPPKEAPKKRRKIPRWVAAAAVVLCLGGVLVAWALSTNSSEASDSALLRVVADGRRALDAAREGLAQRFGIGNGTGPDTPKVVATTAAPAAVQTPRLRRASPPPLPELPFVSIPVARQSFDPAQGPVLVTPVETIVSDPVSPSVLPESGPTDDPSPSVVYTTADPDVEPPQMVFPHLPRVPPSVTGPDINSMEVVVAEDGSVARVRLLSVARRMTDMMLLSGAKSWIFAPAVRDGQPVRYRITINWSASQ